MKPKNLIGRLFQYLGCVMIGFAIGIFSTRVPDQDAYDRGYGDAAVFIAKAVRATNVYSGLYVGEPDVWLNLSNCLFISDGPGVDVSHVEHLIMLGGRFYCGYCVDSNAVYHAGWEAAQRRIGGGRIYISTNEPVELNNVIFEYGVTAITNSTIHLHELETFTLESLVEFSQQAARRDDTNFIKTWLKE